MARERILTDEQFEEIETLKGTKRSDGTKITLKDLAPQYGVPYGSLREALTRYRKRKNGNPITESIPVPSKVPPKRKLPLVTEMSAAEKDLKASRDHWYLQAQELEKENSELERKILRLESQLHESITLTTISYGLGIAQVPIPHCPGCGNLDTVVRNGRGRGERNGMLDLRPQRFWCKEGCGHKWEEALRKYTKNMG